MRVRRPYLYVLCGITMWFSLATQSYSLTGTEPSSSPLRYRGGVHNAFDKHALKPKQLQALLKSLRAHSGWEQLDFDADGFLTCPDETIFNGGSASARKLLLAAMEAPMAFDLESHSNTAGVAFARLNTPIHFRSMASGRQINVYPLQLDFSDFSALRGEAAVLAAFDVGLVFLHEVAHGVWGLRDAQSSADPLGECETYVNQIRRELQLPERQHYVARTRDSGVSYTGGIGRYAELLFMRSDARKQSPYYLQWDTQRVGHTLATTL